MGCALSTISDGSIQRSSLLRERIGLPRERADWVSLGIVALLTGYLCGGRSFAYFGIGKVYIGEVALALFFLSCPLVVFRLGVGSLVRNTPLWAIAWCLYFFLVFGLFQSIRGHAAGHETYIVAQNAVFHVYAIFLLAGIWLGCRHSDLMPRLIWFLATCHGVYGVVYVLVLSPLGLSRQEEATLVAWFGQPNNSAVLLVALLASVRERHRLLVPLFLNVFVLFAIQSRAEWLSLCVGLPLWGYLAGKTKQAIGLMLLTVALVAAWAASGVTIPVPETRGGGQMGGHDVIGRVIAVVDPDSAAVFTDNVERQHGTAAWRVEWWSAIWKMVHETPVRMLVGPGYGYPIWDLHPEGLSDINRTPHNGFVYALAYTGWAGLFLFSIFQFALGTFLWKAYRRTGQPVGFCYWAMCLIRGTFDNYFESPHHGIPFYIMLGFFCAALLVPHRSARSHYVGWQSSGANTCEETADG